MLIRCDPDCLTFINSWGQGFADGGLFRVQDENTLGLQMQEPGIPDVDAVTTFFDIFWNESDLKPSEKEAYRRKCIERAQELFPDLYYKCSHCKEDCRVLDLLEPECPNCHQEFKPTVEDILQGLYSCRS